jgi:hypothetical protein
MPDEIERLEEMNDQELLKEAMELLGRYHDELERMLRRDQFYGQYVRLKELTELEEKTGRFLKKEEKPLTDRQKQLIKLFLDGKCTGGYLLTRIGVWEWKDAERLIEQYRMEEGKKG